MNYEFWQRQEPSMPLFPDMVWSRPENRQHAGKLLIIGGHAQSFAAPAEAYGQAEKAGIGTSRVLLPDSLSKIVSKIFPEAEFVPSTPSGSFARTALSELLSAATWADAVLLAGDFGKNSETAITLESFAKKYPGPLAMTGDAVDYFLRLPAILERNKTLIIPTFSQLQKLTITGHATQPLTTKLDLLHLVQAVHLFVNAHQLDLAFTHNRTIFAATRAGVSTTQVSIYNQPSDVELAAHATVWWLQHQAQPFEALTTAAAMSAHKK